ncbi:MAG: hypothetical protein KF751_05245 [Nitrospira sp.]|nr:hypothetical protein [Nitrospira sp.]MBX3348180.1 hypothetical protein [Nitrospira sp.]
MAISYDVIREGMVILQYWTGKVTRDDIVAYRYGCLTDPRIKRGASILIDARESLFGVSPEKMRAIVDLLYESSFLITHIKNYAPLVNPLTYRLARVQEAIGHLDANSIATFTVLDAACLWLGLDGTMVTSQLELIRKAPPPLPPAP